MKIIADKILLKERLQSTIIKLKDRKEDDKNKTMFVVTYGAIISALTTILIGLSSYISSYSIYFNIAALFSSASITVIHSWDKLFSHKKLWLLEAQIYRELKELEEDIEHLEKTGNLHQDFLNQCYDRYKQIIKKWNTDWLEMRNSE
ncbi:MAG: SLATT domain-containing protein [Saprospiraceae bacterium]|nr:SLATT domain-containing protein [Saprospiraceae bacterium]